jgi:hypothetical protein
VRASSLVENLNSRLRTYFFLRRQLGRVDLGGHPPRPPSDPGVRVKRTRLVIS